MSLRIMIAEDYAALRADLGALLAAEPDLMVVGAVASMCELLYLAGQAPPDIILLDIDLPDLMGFENVRRLSEALPASRILLLTRYLDAGLGRDALLAGAAGCVLSQTADATLAVAVRAVAQGRLYVEERVIRALLAELLAQAESPGFGALTPPEVELLRLLAQGYTNRQAAEALALSPQAVECRRAQLLDKLGLHSRADLLRYAARRLPEPPPDGRQYP